MRPLFFLIFWLLPCALYFQSTVAAAQQIPVQEVLREATQLEAQQLWDDLRPLTQQALERVDISPIDRAKLMLLLAKVEAAESADSRVFALVEQITQQQGTDPLTKADAHLLAAGIYSNYGGQPSWGKVRSACAAVLELNGLDEGRKTAARRAIVPALLVLREYNEARQTLSALLASPEVPSQERVAFQTLVGKTFFLQDTLDAALAELDKAAVLAKKVARSPETDRTTADIQLLTGLCFLEKGDSVRAKEHLLRVTALPGQTPASAQTREALLRLKLRKLIPEDTATMKVLFIGSSHTIRGNVPLLVEQLSASAPAGVPRILGGEHVRMGTGMKTFWDEGDAHDTARGKIAAEPWDAVVVETFFKNTAELLDQYLANYAGLVWGKGSQLVVYESPVAKAQTYPKVFADFHRLNVSFTRKFGLPLAPSVHAWMQVFGESPRGDSFNALYADWIHANMKGAYLSACCIYSSLTGTSAEGLAFPSELSAQEASSFQKTAWRAYLESR